MFCTRGRSSLATLFSTRSTLVATSSKLDGSADAACVHLQLGQNKCMLKDVNLNADIFCVFEAGYIKALLDTYVRIRAEDLYLQGTSIEHSWIVIQWCLDKNCPNSEAPLNWQDDGHDFLAMALCSFRGILGTMWGQSCLTGLNCSAKRIIVVTP